MSEIFGFTWGWIIAGVAIAALEIIVPGIFLLWVGLGALAVGVILSLAPDLPLAWQIIVFALSMLSSLGLGFMIQRRSRRDDAARHLNRESQAMVGRRFVAITAFKAGRGRIRVADSSYSALGEDDIVAGDVVEVIAFEAGRPRVVRTGE